MIFGKGFGKFEKLVQSDPRLEGDGGLSGEQAGHLIVEGNRLGAYDRKIVKGIDHRCVAYLYVWNGDHRDKIRGEYPKARKFVEVRARNFIEIGRMYDGFMSFKRYSTMPELINLDKLNRGLVPFPNLMEFLICKSEFWKAMRDPSREKIRGKKVRSRLSIPDHPSVKN